jgi:hypothetical protein
LVIAERRTAMAKSKGKGKKASTKARNLPPKTLSAGKARAVKGGYDLMQASPDKTTLKEA